MAKKKIIFIIAIITISIIMFYSPKIYAYNAEGTDGGGGSSGGSSTQDQYGGISLDLFKPTPDNSSTVTTKVSTILSWLIVIGVIAAVIIIAIIGFSFIMGSSSEKAVAKEKFIGILVGAVLITFGSAIAKIIISVAESFQ